MKEKVAFIFECVMAVFYLAVAAAFLFTRIFPQVQGSGRTGVGVVLAVYGVYRVWRAVRKML
ncbi:hypothetical protein AGMMS49965_07690 [Bacteroidia bacterium]|nr:hypothetical protein AGMMS49965_07690 [Bacteroidia bacterium]